jgi:site-specific DNA-methyltransferase (adenine-specific)
MTATRTEQLSDGVTLMLGDAREIVGMLTGVDAVITDPPYGINWKPRVNHKDQVWVDDVQFDPSPFLGIGRYHLFWGGQYFAASLPNAEGWLTWVKRPIATDFSGDQRTFSTTELAWRDWGKARFMCHVWDGGKRAGDPDNRTFCHPSQKPIELMDWCIRQLPSDARCVFDPFMGSGTTGIAAVRAGLNFIGSEIEQSYFDIACRRISDELKRPRLFTEAPAKPVQTSMFAAETA